MIAAVDWPLLLLVSCLFAITGALNHSGVAAELLEFLTNHDLLPDSLALLTPFSVLMTRWPCCRASPAIFCSPAA